MKRIWVLLLLAAAPAIGCGSSDGTPQSVANKPLPPSGSQSEAAGPGQPTVQAPDSRTVRDAALRSGSNPSAGDAPASGDSTSSAPSASSSLPGDDATRPSALPPARGAPGNLVPDSPPQVPGPDAEDAGARYGAARNGSAGNWSSGNAAAGNSTDATAQAGQAAQGDGAGAGPPRSDASAAPRDASSGPPLPSGGAADDGRQGASVAVARADTSPSRPAAGALSDGVLSISFDNIKFEMEKGAEFRREYITKEIEALVGKRIRIRGYILPASVFKQTGNKQFILVRDNQECCFGPGAALYDCVVVKMVGGNTADYTVRPIAVEGVFSIQEMRDFVTDKVVAIYHLEATSAK